MRDWSHDHATARILGTTNRHDALRSFAPIALMSMTNPQITREFTGRATVNAPLEQVYAALLDPGQQLLWNSLYLEAKISAPGPITTGSVMTGRFKGAGKSVVTFDAVVPHETFTHVSQMTAGPVNLGTFRHTYRVRPVAEGTEVTQHIRYIPSGLGRLVAPVLMRAFSARLPASFDELCRYVDGP